jgi:hypothetical protein
MGYSGTCSCRSWPHPKLYHGCRVPFPLLFLYSISNSPLQGSEVVGKSYMWVVWEIKDHPMWPLFSIISPSLPNTKHWHWYFWSFKNHHNLRFPYFGGNCFAKYRTRTKACVHRLDLEYNHFACLFDLEKMAFVCDSQHTPLWKMSVFSMFYTLRIHKNLWICIQFTYKKAF